MDKEKITVKELGETNYQFWSFQMRNLLIAKDLWDVFEDDQPLHPGDRPQPPEDEPNVDQYVVMAANYDERMKKFNEWQKKSKKVMAYIGLSVDSTNANLIYRITQLRNYHQQSSM